MRKIVYKKGKKVQPVFLEYMGLHKIAPTMQLFVFDTDLIVEIQDIALDSLSENIDYQKVNWLNLHGLNDINLIESLGKNFHIDSFILGDILNTTKRTKIEEYSDVLFFNIKSLLPSKDTDSIDVEQISFILKEGVLISFQEKKSDFFAHIRERIRTHSGIVREKKADYLLFLLLDAVMENFYITIENEEEKVEDLINLSKTSDSPMVLVSIEKHRDNFNFLKRAILPLRDSLYAIKSIKDDNVFNSIERENYSFFERLYQKSLELLEQIEYDMNTLESASNFYFATQSQRMNEIMKILTIVTVIFIPLTFVVGVYGMNFKNMPELDYHNGYYIVIGTMFLIAMAMSIYFKIKKWY